MKSKSHNRALGLLACALTGGALLSTTPIANAGVTLNIDDDRWVKIGAGLRASITSTDATGATSPTDMAINNMRFYLTAQAMKDVQFTFNTEKDGDDNIKMLDAAAKFHINDALNIWAGRVVLPTDRANLDGPFYQAAFDFPSVRKYPAINAGRDDGVIFWGLTNEKKVKYYFGATQGKVGGPNDSGSLLYSGRVALNLWDAEAGYFNRSTYHGKKDILSFGIGGAYQADGAGTLATPGDFTAWNADFLLEKKLSTGGVATLEGAYYSYDLDGVTDASLKAGNSYLALASYLFPTKVGIGQFQPYARVQQFDYDAAGSGTMDKTELGMNYVISSHNALISAVVTNTDVVGSPSVSTFKLGTQIQF